MEVLTAAFLSLALYHAPVIYHQTGHNAKADQLTRVDFDGDFNTNNNWENLDQYSTPAHVYYDVFETQTHYFISYAFFHPRDYSNVCVPKICHENDMEGTMMMVQKDGSEYGRVVLLQTLAHDRIFTYRKPRHVPVNPSQDLMGRSERVALYIEWGGHGVYEHNPGRDIEAMRARFFVYSVGTHADDIGEAREGSFQYSLLNIKDELWNRRAQLGNDQLFLRTYNYAGQRINMGRVPLNFGGTRFSTGLAKPPWAWADTSRKDVIQGDWFFDPALFVSKTLMRVKRNIKALPEDKFSMSYVHHPYVDPNLN